MSSLKVNRYVFPLDVEDVKTRAFALYHRAVSAMECIQLPWARSADSESLQPGISIGRHHRMQRLALIERLVTLTEDFLQRTLCHFFFFWLYETNLVYYDSKSGEHILPRCSKEDSWGRSIPVLKDCLGFQMVCLQQLWMGVYFQPILAGHISSVMTVVFFINVWASENTCTCKRRQLWTRRLFSGGKSSKIS